MRRIVLDVSVLALGILGGACVVMPPLPAGLPRTGGGPPVAAPRLDEMARDVFDRVNRQRQSVGLAALSWDPTLALLATRHSEDMATGRVGFGHDGFDGRIAAARSALSVTRASENVATNNFPADRVGSQAVTGWIGSPGHRENMEGPYQLTGVGVASTSRGEYYITQIYIAP